MTAQSRLIPLLLLGALGCDAETFGAGDIAIDPTALVVAEGLPIAGNRVLLAAPWIAEMPERFEIGIDDRPLMTVARDTALFDRIALDIPADLTPGWHEIRSASGANVGRIGTGGIAERRTVEGSFSGVAQPVPTLPGLISTGQVQIDGHWRQAVVVLDARRGTFSSLPGTTTEPYGIGSSYQAGRYFLYQQWSGGYWLRLGTSLGRMVVDSVPIYGSWWPTHELAPGLYLQDMKHWTQILDLSSGTNEEFGNPGYTRPEQVAYSADGKWAVPSHGFSSRGIAIFDRQTRTFHWGAGWRYDARPFFLPDGQLVVYGLRGSETDLPLRPVLAKVDATTGEIQDSVAVVAPWYEHNQPVALTIRDWIVIPEQREQDIVLSIRDPHDLRELASVTVEVGGPFWVNSGGLAIIEDPALDRFYLTSNYSNTGIPIWTFQPPPLPTTGTAAQ